ncbi:MAG TPA: efflux RND transporter periplasmic adaptor subunit [Candidatus Saccharimonadaceae bacterium]|nr:efflux RND transporter periplasmic adaptor subunit [Candidatus Saccharimonadaceae bacterium]
MGLIVLAALVFATRRLASPRPIAVEAAAVERGAVEDVVANSEGGTVRSRAEARLGVERAGRVARILFREGARVRAGTVVLALESSTAATQLEAARRDFEAADAAHEAAHAAELLARQDLARREPLRRDGLISAEEIDAARSRLESTAAELRVAEARRAGAQSAVRLAEDELAHLVVRAPFDGVLTRRDVEIGESVVPGQTVLELVALDRLYVSAPIDERDAGRLARGLPARVTLDAYPGVEWPVSVTRVAPMVETVKEQNRTIEVELDLRPDGSRPPPRPGMTADVEIVLARRDAVLRIPSLALLEGDRVLVAERGRAAARQVRTGLRNWQWTEIQGGLGPGERVITSLDRLGVKAGARIAIAANPRGEPAAADSAATAALP